MPKIKKAAVSSSRAGHKKVSKIVRRNVKKSNKSSGPRRSVKRNIAGQSAKAAGSAKNSKQNFEQRSTKLIEKGRSRGFVTYDEILKEFPQIENDIMFLDELYAKLASANVDVLEGGGLLEVEEVKDKKNAPHIGRGSDSAYDSIQMYLREIGQYPLINASMEKELAKRIQKEDTEAKK